jgi:hypothetical protein
LFAVIPFRLALGAICAIAFHAVAEDRIMRIQVDPETIRLDGPDSRHSVLVTGTTSDGRVVDLSRNVKLLPADEKLVRTEGNVIRGLAEGTSTIRVEADGKSATIAVQVTNSARPREFHFENDIEPLFGRFGCNSSGCHGKAEGQNGFKLSVFGFDPIADYVALVKEARGRRIFPAAPERSLFLMKAAGQVPHGGGTRIPVGSDAYQTIRGWIAAGAPIGRADAPSVKGIRVEPAERILGMTAQQQLRVIARYSDGREVDVTHAARFQSNNDAVALVAVDGLVKSTDQPGEAAVMASFANEVGVFRVLVPRGGAIDYPKLPENNFIDPLVDAKLKKLRIVPSPGVDDAEFARRVYLDVIGTLPTVDEVRKFLADKQPDKRSRLVDALLDRPEFADYWALKWSDVLRVDRQALGHQGAYAYYRWIRQSIAENKPFDRFAREVITAEGPLDEFPAGGFYKVLPKAGDAANTLSQVFLGVRIACAECHHHPFDRWGQDDYYGMAAFFSPIAVRPVGSVTAVVANGESVATHLRTGAKITATPLGATPLAATKGDRREELASWMTSGENPFFARNLVNRLWAHFLGRGLIEPVDDVRSTNPPTNPELLDALAKKFIASKFDLKEMVRVICASRVYQTASTPNETNKRDDQNYSRALFKRPDAEVLMDMVLQVTDVPEKFDGMPLGTRAIQLWDSKVRHYFLKQFGRPSRTSSCECDRVGEPNIAQILHLLNSDFIDHRLRHEDGRIARWVRKIDDDEKLLEEMCLTFLGRSVKPAEVTFVREHIAKSKSRREAFEDIGWALLNSKEFMFNH